MGLPTMTLINWFGLGLTAVILAVCIPLYIHFRRKVTEMEGFQGFVTEQGKRRRPVDWIAEAEKSKERNTTTQ